MKNTIPSLNNGKIAVSELSPETKLMHLDALTREMVKILITLSPSQKEAVMQNLIRVSDLNQVIDRLLEKRMVQ